MRSGGPQFRSAPSVSAGVFNYNKPKAGLQDISQPTHSARSNASSAFRVNYNEDDSHEPTYYQSNETPRTGNDSFFHVQMRMQQQFGGSSQEGASNARGGGHIGGGSLYGQRGEAGYAARSASVSSRDFDGERRSGSHSRSAMQDSYRRLAGSTQAHPPALQQQGATYRSSGGRIASGAGGVGSRNSSPKVGADYHASRSSVATSRSHTPNMLAARPPFNSSGKDHRSSSTNKSTPSTSVPWGRDSGSRSRRGTPNNHTAIHPQQQHSGGGGGLSSSWRNSDPYSGQQQSAPSTARSVPSHISFAAASSDGRRHQHHQDLNSTSYNGGINVATMLKNIADLASQIAHQAVSAEQAQTEQLSITSGPSQPPPSAVSSALKAQEIERIVKRVETHFSSKVAAITVERDEALAKVALLEKQVGDMTTANSHRGSTSNTSSPVRGQLNLHNAQKQLQHEKQQRMEVEEQSQRLSENHSKTVAGLEERIRRQERQIRDLYTTLSSQSNNSHVSPNSHEATVTARNLARNFTVNRTEVSPPPSPAEDDEDDDAESPSRLKSEARWKQQLEEESRVVSEARRQSQQRLNPQSKPANPKAESAARAAWPRSVSDAEYWLSPPRDGDEANDTSPDADKRNSEALSGINGTPKQAAIDGSSDPSPLTQVLRDLANDKETLLGGEASTSRAGGTATPRGGGRGGRLAGRDESSNYQVVEMSMQRAASLASTVSTKRHQLENGDNDVEGEDLNEEGIIVVKGIHGQPNMYINTKTGETIEGFNVKTASTTNAIVGKRPSTPTPGGQLSYQSGAGGALHRLTPRSSRAMGTNSGANTPISHPASKPATSTNATQPSSGGTNGYHNEYYGDSDDDPDVAAAFGNVSKSSPLRRHTTVNEDHPKPPPLQQPKPIASSAARGSVVHSYRSADTVDVVEDVTAFLEGLNKELQALDAI